MSIKKIFYVAVFLLTFNLTAEGRYDSHLSSQNIITLNYPPDKTIMEFSLLSISLSVPQGSVDLIRVDVNDEKRLKIIPDSEFECFFILLTLGINKIDITAIKEGRCVDEVSLTVFRRSDLVGEYKDPPAGFQKDYFHMKDRSQCAACHTLEPSEADKKPINIATFTTETLMRGKKAAETTSTCYSCHKGITYFPSVHSPAAVWSCLSCHDYQSEPKYFVMKPDTEACFNCHIEEKKDWNAKKHIHGPVNTGKCTICHSPHASENPFNLVKPTWNLCVSCHVDNGTGRHILAGYVYEEGHPTRGRPDPLRKGKELSCASCHNPHASDFPRLWALNAQSPFELCQKCHLKYF